MKSISKPQETAHQAKLRKANELLAKANLKGLMTSPKQTTTPSAN